MIVLGSATLIGSSVVMKAPVGGFGGIKAVRLTNYTGDAIILQNITGSSPGAQELLMPFQTNVFPCDNIRDAPTAVGVTLGSTFATASLFVEWSDDPIKDFPGTYPSQVTQAPINPSNASDGVVVMAANASGQIAANPLRLQTTFYNTGPGVVFWSQKSTTVLGAGTSASLPVGAGITLDGGQSIFLKADGSGASVSFFG